MDSVIEYKTGDSKVLSSEFVELIKNKNIPKRILLENPSALEESKVLAIRFTSDGGQGDLGGVDILCHTEDGVKILYGNYYYGKLNLGEVLQKLPIISTVYRPRSPFPPYPYGEEPDFPEDWTHVYMGLGNHLFVRPKIYEKAESFLEALFDYKYSRFTWFDAIAWFCGAEYQVKD